MQSISSLKSRFLQFVSPQYEVSIPSSFSSEGAEDGSPSSYFPGVTVYSDGIGVGTWSLRLSNWAANPATRFKENLAGIAEIIVDNIKNIDVRAPSKFVFGLILSDLLPTAVAGETRFRDNKGLQYALTWYRQNVTNGFEAELLARGCEATFLSPPYEPAPENEFSLLHSYCRSPCYGEGCISSARPYQVNLFLLDAAGTNGPSKMFLTCFNQTIYRICKQNYNIEFNSILPTAFLLTLVIMGGTILCMYRFPGNNLGIDIGNEEAMRAIVPRGAANGLNNVNQEAVAVPKILLKAKVPEPTAEERFEKLKDQAELILKNPNTQQNTLEELKIFLKEMDAFSKIYSCPITLLLMEHPVAMSTGISFERDSILTYIKSNGVKCPTTHEEFTLEEKAGHLPKETLLTRDQIQQSLKGFKDRFLIILEAAEPSLPSSDEGKEESSGAIDESKKDQ
jgi:hypothetical protein